MQSLMFCEYLFEIRFQPTSLQRIAYLCTLKFNSKNLQYVSRRNSKTNASRISKCRV